MFEDHPLPPEQAPPTEPSEHSSSTAQETQAVASPDSSVAGDPIALAAATPAAWSALPPPTAAKPEEINMLFYWLHFLAFGVFGVISLVIVQLGLLLRYVPVRSLTNQKEVERIIMSKPLVAVGTMVIWYALVFLFLYVTFSALRGVPFWRSLGWKKLDGLGAWPKNPWAYLCSGCGLSLLVFAATAKMNPPEDIPIQELFKYKSTAMLFMAMAVLVAPLVEETIFRGYLYPLFARSFGIGVGIVITGVLFGLMHGAQLGWTWGLVSVLIVVGLIFTFVRARTGSTLASFLLHLGYNSTIAVFTILGLELSKFALTH